MKTKRGTRLSRAREEIAQLPVIPHALTPEQFAQQRRKEELGEFREAVELLTDARDFVRAIGRRDALFLDEMTPKNGARLAIERAGKKLERAMANAGRLKREHLMFRD